MKYLKGSLVVFVLFILAACTLSGCTTPPTATAAPAAEVVASDEEVPAQQADAVVASQSSASVETVVMFAAEGPKLDCFESVDVTAENVVYGFCQSLPFHYYVDGKYQPADGVTLPMSDTLSVSLSLIAKSVEVVIWPDEDELRSKLYLEVDDLQSIAAAASSTEVLTNTAEVSTTEVLTTPASADAVTVVAEVHVATVGPCTQSWVENSDGTATLQLDSNLGYHYVSMDNGEIWVNIPSDPSTTVHYVVATSEGKGAIAEIFGATRVTITVPMGTHRPDGTLCSYPTPVSRTYLARESEAKMSPSGVRPAHLVFNPDGGVIVQ